MGKKYDLVFSLGAACACTECLRAAGLQFSSFPFDWLFGSTLSRRVDILVDGCDDWLRPELLEHVFSATAVRTEAYRNRGTDIVFNHDFPSGVPMAEALVGVREKYDRRFKRLRSRLTRGGRVLAVYVTPPPAGVPPTVEEVVSVRRRLGQRFPAAQWELLVLRPGEGIEPLVEMPDEGIRFVTFDYQSRTDTTGGANPVDRDRVVEVLHRLGLRARDYRSVAERRSHRAALRAKEYRRFRVGGFFGYLMVKCQYKLYAHLRKRLERKGLV